MAGTRVTQIMNASLSMHSFNLNLAAMRIPAYKTGNL